MCERGSQLISAGVVISSGAVDPVMWMQEESHYNTPPPPRRGGVRQPTRRRRGGLVALLGRAGRPPHCLTAAGHERGRRRRETEAGNVGLGG